METNTVTPTLTFFASSSATRRWITPLSSSFWMRRQQGVVERPICLPISATGIGQSFCRMSRIFLSIRSSMAFLIIFFRDSSTIGIPFLFHTNSTKLVEYSFFCCKRFFQEPISEEFAHLPAEHRQKLVLEPW